MAEKDTKEMVGKTVEEAAEKIAEEVGEAAESVNEKVSSASKKFMDYITPITEKVRDLVLGFGEIIITVTVIIGLISALIGGLSEMGNVGFFSGLSSMFTEMSGVIMGALMIFLLFGIYRNTEKGSKKK
jgi:hypothetical protein